MLPLDVTSEESAEAAVKEVLRLHGRIDLLVNNAGFGVAPAAAEDSSIDHELRMMGIRVSVIEPAYIKTPFDANFMAPDAPLDAYREVRSAVDKRVKEVVEGADSPEVVAETVLQAAIAARPKLRYAAGGLAVRLRLLRRFAPAGLVDAGIRKDLRLRDVDSATACETT
ncbi:SDR family NAD(P)-dependent oxidoreductase [Cupriavidus basilensis]|nr:SDR family NAD(P)-dependent oxidoreductase [Cupriavidus basilensis]